MTEPPAVNPITESVLLPAAETAYSTDNFVLLANRIDTCTDGHCHEHVEASSDTGELPLTATILRRNEHSDSDETSLTEFNRQPGNSASSPRWL